MNEIEVRKVRRALDRAAGAVEPLPEAEVAAMARAATAAGRRSRPRRRWRAAAPAALAGAAIASLVFVPWLDRSERTPSRSAATPGGIVDFPAGSALDRLLAEARKGRQA